MEGGGEVIVLDDDDDDVSQHGGGALGRGSVGAGAADARGAVVYLDGTGPRPVRGVTMHVDLCADSDSDSSDGEEDEGPAAPAPAPEPEPEVVDLLADDEQDNNERASSVLPDCPSQPLAPPGASAAEGRESSGGERSGAADGWSERVSEAARPPEHPPGSGAEVTSQEPAETACVSERDLPPGRGADAALARLEAQLGTSPTDTGADDDSGMASAAKDVVQAEGSRLVELGSDRGAGLENDGRSCGEGGDALQGPAECESEGAGEQEWSLEGEHAGRESEEDVEGAGVDGASPSAPEADAGEDDVGEDVQAAGDGEDQSAEVHTIELGALFERENPPAAPQPSLDELPDAAGRSRMLAWLGSGKVPETRLPTPAAARPAGPGRAGPSSRGVGRRGKRKRAEDADDGTKSESEEGRTSGAEGGPEMYCEISYDEVLNDEYCAVCSDGCVDGGSLLYQCDGPCCRSFHIACTEGYRDDGEEWWCANCVKLEHDCAICGKRGRDGVEVKQCEFMKCGLFFHEACLSACNRTYSVAGGKLVCPAHYCGTCNELAQATEHGKLYSCWFCRIRAFHKRCRPKGTQAWLPKDRTYEDLGQGAAVLSCNECQQDPSRNRLRLSGETFELEPNVTSPISAEAILSELGWEYITVSTRLIGGGRSKVLSCLTPTHKLDIFKTDQKGLGVRCLHDLPANATIGEYAGEYCRESVVGTREHENQLKHYTFNTRDPDGGLLCIDATEKGNFSRLINHSCNANLKATDEQRKAGEPFRIVLKTRVAVKRGTELTLDYSPSGRKAGMEGKVRCLCKTPRCRGFVFWIAKE